MMRIKIYGAGSIGNHLANAARRLGHSVVICDVSEESLRRAKEDIYPLRYGAWDNAIELYLNDDAPKGGFDLICIGTPPEHHIPLGMKALEEDPKSIQIEKPLCGPDLVGAREFWDLAKEKQVPVFIGYDHVIGRASRRAEEIIASGEIGKVLSLDAEFREHWEGIFKAHPWLNGPQDTYLGYWKRGGGASGEHSHALNIWQHFSHVCGFGGVTEVFADLEYVEENGAEFDRVCFLQLKTESGVSGRVVQDVITRPSSKRIFFIGTEGRLEWVANYSSEGDAIIHHKTGQKSDVEMIPKTRPDDFIEELEHIKGCLESREESPISLQRGMDTMHVLAAAHESTRERKAVPVTFW